MEKIPTSATTSSPPCNSTSTSVVNTKTPPNSDLQAAATWQNEESFIFRFTTMLSEGREAYNGFSLTNNESNFLAVSVLSGAFVGGCVGWPLAGLSVAILGPNVVYVARLVHAMTKQPS